MKRAWVLSLVISAMAVLFPILVSCSSATMEDIKGQLQAADLKSVVITAADGTTVQLKIQDEKLAAQIKDLVGEHVVIKARVEDRSAVGVERLGSENAHFSGTIESIGNGTAVVGGRTFRVLGSTRLDGGLVPGAVARVEFVKLPDGSLAATEIETDKSQVRITGAIDAIKADSVVIGGQTFILNPATRLGDGLAPGVPARVEFVKMADGTMVAVEIERQQGQDRFTGKVDSMRSGSMVIDGKTVQVNAATRFERGLEEGAIATVRVVKLSDDSLVAVKVEVDRSRIEIQREQDLQKREAELRGREQELQKRETEFRGREAELRGRVAEGETEVRGREAEARGRVAEGETEVRGREAEARGRVAEGETEVRGQEAEVGRGGGGDSGGGGSSGSGGSGGGGGSGNSN